MALAIAREPSGKKIKRASVLCNVKRCFCIHELELSKPNLSKKSTQLSV